MQCKRQHTKHEQIRQWKENCASGANNLPRLAFTPGVSLASHVRLGDWFDCTVQRWSVQL